MLFLDDIPPKVSIDEAVELGKKFGTEESGAFINGILDKIVKEYKKQFTTKYGNRKNPYRGNKTRKQGLARWFDEKWTNQRGEIGYKNKSDVYRPSIRINKGTPTTFDELTPTQIRRARREKYRKGHVSRFLQK